ncbi:MAG TPA: TMEM175 family protein [Allosphingosinicella sp.]|jgi:uncharacterized membrane protein
MPAKTDHTLERLVFFSDAVFAIAITLLVLEVGVPHLPKGSPAAAFGAPLDALIPSLFGYIVSFAVIGMFWVTHHRAFACTVHYRPKVLAWNMMLLGCIALMPWVTAFMSSNIRSQLPWIVYCGALTVTALLSYGVVRLATGPEMAGEKTARSPEALYVRRRSLATLIGAALSFGIVFLLPGYWHFSLLAMVLARRGVDAAERVRAKRAPQP